MFADATNLFYSNSSRNELCGSVNKELPNFIDWCLVNKLSINTSKTIFFFRKQTDWNNIHLKLSDLKFNKILNISSGSTCMD